MKKKLYNTPFSREIDSANHGNGQKRTFCNNRRLQKANSERKSSNSRRSTSKSQTKTFHFSFSFVISRTLFTIRNPLWLNKEKSVLTTAFEFIEASLGRTLLTKALARVPEGGYVYSGHIVETNTLCPPTIYIELILANISENFCQIHE